MLAAYYRLLDGKTILILTTIGDLRLPNKERCFLYVDVIGCNSVISQAFSQSYASDLESVLDVILVLVHWETWRIYVSDSISFPIQLPPIDGSWIFNCLNNTIQISCRTLQLW